MNHSSIAEETFADVPRPGRSKTLSDGTRATGKSAKIRVLNSITGLNIGGAEYMLLRYLRALPREHYAPSIMTLIDGCPLERQALGLGLEISTVKMTQNRVSPAALFRLGAACRQQKPDLVHGWMYHGNVAASLAAMTHRRQPVIWSVHHSLNDISVEKRLTRWLIRLSARLSSGTASISYCSRTSADQHEAAGFDPSKRVVIPNGTDCEEFRPDPGAGDRLKAMLGLPQPRIVIGNIGRAHPMKDHANLVRAIGLLLQQGLDVQGLVIGDGHEDGAAAAAARDLGIVDRISILGPRDDIPEIMPGLDIYALCSAWGEAFPLAVSEAMACGVPSVATALGDCDWLIGDDDFIVPTRSPEALAAVLKDLAGLARNERARIGMRGRRRIMENFSLESYVERHLALYRHAMATRRGEPA